MDQKKLQTLMEDYHKFCMSEGGEVTPQEGFLDSVKKAFSKPTPAPTPDPKQTKYDQIRKENHERAMGDRSSEFVGYADGGPVIDPQKAQDVQDSMRKAFHFSKGGMVQNLADGGQALSNEDFQQHLADLQAQGMKLTNVDLDPGANINGQASAQPVQQSMAPQPASDQQVTTENPDDKQLENNYANQDFQATEDAGEPKPDEAKSADSDTEPDREPASDQESEPSAISRLISQMKPEAKNNLTDAQHERDMNIMTQKMEKGAALAGAGMAKSSPDEVLGAIRDNDKYVGLPVQKYDEQIANQKNDPNSQMSQAYRDLYGQLMGKPANPNWSANDLEKVSPLFEKYMQAKETAQAKRDIAAQNLQMRMESEKNRHELALQSAKDRSERMAETARHNQEMEKLRSSMVDLSNQRLGMNAVRSIEQHPIVVAFDKRIESTRSALDQLNDKNQPLTANRLNAIQIDLAGTMPLLGVGTSDYKAKSDKLINLQTRIADLKQRWGNSIIDMRKAAPDVYREVMSFANSMHDSLASRRQEKVHELSKNYTKGVGEGSQTGGRLNDIYNPEQQSNEEERFDKKSGKVAIFDRNTKKFLRWKE